jgi:peptidoglycan/LPS O-acetylase OafA/YrhL
MINCSLTIQNSQASVALDSIRAVSAQAVVIGHGLSFFNIYPTGVPYVQNIAVQLFFVLSGFLIAYALARTDTFTNYFINRFSRIYSAYLPALLLIAAVDLWLISLGRYEFADYLTLRVFVGNVFMLFNWPLTNWWQIPALGSAGPLWTLAVEWHIYLAVGALYFVPRHPWLIVVAAPFSLVPAWFLLSSVQPGVGTGLTTLWLLGFLGYFLFERIRRIGIGLSIFCAISLVTYAALLEQGREYQIAIYPLLALAFLCAVAFASRFQKRQSNIVRLFADYSFTLYLIHYTILYSLFRLLPEAGIWGTVLGIVLSNGIAFLLAVQTEMKHKELARWMRRKWSLGAAGAR